MISDEQVAKIRSLFHAEHWKIGTIATELGLHSETVRAALDPVRFRRHPRLRDRLTDPYLDFLRQTLQQYPRLRATRLLQMICPRGYTGNISQLRRIVAELRPTRREAFLRLHSFPGEQGPVSRFGRGAFFHRRCHRRRLSATVLAKSADEQRVPAVAGKTYDGDSGLTAGREDELADAKQRRAWWNVQQLGCFLVRVGEFDSIVVLQGVEERAALQRRDRQARKFVSRQITSFQREGFVGGLPDASDLDQIARRRKREPGGNLGFRAGDA